MFLFSNFFFLGTNQVVKWVLGCLAFNFKQCDTHTLEHSIIFFELEKYDSIQL